MEINLCSICDEVMGLAQKHKVDADVLVRNARSTGFSFRNLKAESSIFSDELSIVFRIIKNRKCVSISTNDASQMVRLMNKALEILPFVIEDPFVQIISMDDVRSVTSSVADFVPFPSADFLRDQASIADSHAMKQNNIKNVGESSCAFVEEHISFSTSTGFRVSRTSHRLSLAIDVIAQGYGDDSDMSSGYDYSIVCSPKQLKDPILLADSAVMRACWGLGAKKVPSAIVPVVFEKRVANDILGSLLEAINGYLVSNKMSFLKDSLNKRICSDKISVIDDPLRYNSPFSSTFDSEGYKTEKIYCITDGVLSSWILDIHSANKMGLKSTGHAHRGDNGIIKPATYSAYLETKDDISKESMIEDIRSGLYVTEAFSGGYNSTNGDYSKGVKGFWIENGKISFPVSEITIAGNLSSMLSTMIAANDLSFDYQNNSPTLLIPKMTVSGL